MRAEALREEFPIDRPVYERSVKDPLEPVLFAGSLQAKVAVFGRDLGKDEVAAGEPLIGAGGRLVRAGVFEALEGIAPPASDRTLASVLDHVLLTNTVPYKPPGNKAYAKGVKERFRPMVAELLVDQWTGGVRALCRPCRDGGVLESRGSLRGRAGLRSCFRLDPKIRGSFANPSPVATECPVVQEVSGASGKAAPNARWPAVRMNDRSDFSPESHLLRVAYRQGGGYFTEMIIFVIRLVGGVRSCARCRW